MHFSQLKNGGNKTGQFALVAGLHVAFGLLFVQSLNVRLIAPAPRPDIPVDLKPEPPEPTPPLDPPKPVNSLPLPPLFVPPPDVVTTPPPEAAIVATTSVPDPAPPRTAIGDPTTVTPPVGPATDQASNNAGRLRTAVLADPNACALPEYPARAARNGESGITSLALLVGTDGRVASARIERSSGSRDLDRAALAALSLCRFKPATNNGVPESGWAQLSYAWTLE